MKGKKKMKNNDILNYINNNGGITLNKEGNKAKLTDGFMVSLYGSEYKTNNKKEVLSKVKEYLDSIKDPNEKFNFFFYQRLFLRAALRHRYMYATLKWECVA